MKSIIKFLLLIIIDSFAVNASPEIDQTATNFMELRKYNSSAKLSTNYIPPEHIRNVYSNGSLLSISCIECGIKKLLDSNFIGTPRLIELILISNEIKYIESNMFKGLNNLKILDIGDNQIEILNNDLLQYLPNLKEFYAVDNTIHYIDSNIFNTNYIYYNIDISYNPIIELNLDFQHIKKMKCEYCELKKVTLNGAVYELYMTGNEIKKLDLSNNLNLTIINLNYNNLTSSVIKSINGNMLRNLMLHGTKLNYSYLGDNIFKSMPHLTSLTLSATNLSYINKQLLKPLKNLEKLWIQENNISKIDIEVLVQLPNLKDIAWENNPWKCSSLLPILRTYQLPKLSEEDIQDLITTSNVCTDDNYQFELFVVRNNKITLLRI